MMPVFLDKDSKPAAPREDGWYILDGTDIRDEGPFTTEVQASLWIDDQEPDPIAGETLPSE
ncbi:hypothetical protein [Brytella acorum]|uniref:Uncharacterized protein n=1 Tax=Brytella acorum TaxID=2959299 RepID=A0AA35UNL8_9PROT|nr:hypothetical protein [Brytella acorum]MDF3625302.1 hypothetical protein [Brytella acorum]CAI9119284.1 hypothetical protein LMG32879_000097 [Brytella acorum]